MHKKLWTFGISSRSVKCYCRSSHIIFNILIFSILSVYDIIIYRSLLSTRVFSHSAESPENPVPAATRLPKLNTSPCRDWWGQSVGLCFNFGKTSKKTPKMKKLPNSQTLSEKMRENLKGKLNCESVRGGVALPLDVYLFVMVWWILFLV